MRPFVSACQPFSVVASRRQEHDAMEKRARMRQHHIFPPTRLPHGPLLRPDHCVSRIDVRCVAQYNQLYGCSSSCAIHGPPCTRAAHAALRCLCTRSRALYSIEAHRLRVSVATCHRVSSKVSCITCVWMASSHRRFPRVRCPLDKRILPGSASL